MTEFEDGDQERAFEQESMRDPNWMIGVDSVELGEQDTCPLS